MKIRDIQHYVEAICGTSSLDCLGQNEDELLLKIHGAKSKVDSIIKSSSSFASNAQEQLFYEFVQNAFDANADTLLFNANEEFLVVLNNGAPFISTKNCLTNDIPGELYSFLAKGKSDKEGNDDTLGQYGQGSKLLYTLISDGGIGNSEEKLLHSIKDLRKGPYLVSWNNPVQLSNFLLNRSGWEYIDPDDYQNAILICKILYSYYPIAPGIDQSFFSDEEYHKIVDAFDKLVDPKRNLNKMQRGTALIVPLGNGQYKAISEQENIDNVKRRLGGFVSITNSLHLNQNKHLKNILVFGEDVIQDHIESIVVEFELADTRYHYLFAFNSIFANEGYVNFFKYLPIVDSKLHLGFIVDSQNFALDNSRQRILEKEKTSEELRYAFNILREQIEELKNNEENRDKFDYIYNCLLETHIPDDEDRRYVKKAFDAVFKDFFQQNVLTKDGTYQKYEDVRHIKNSRYEIDFEKVGIKDRYWISEDVYHKLLNNHNIEAQEIDLYNTIVSVDPKHLAHWILGLSDEEYQRLHYDLSTIKRQQKVRNLKLFRSNLNNLYSPEEIEGNELIFYFDRTFKKDILGLCKEVEYIVEEYEFVLDKDARRDSEQKSIQAMFSKIEGNQEYFSQSHGRQEFACAILSRIVSLDKDYDVENLAILRDRQGKAKPFNQLFQNRPSNTSIIDNFICSYIPSFAHRNWFIDEQADGWNWIYENTEELFTINDWPENHLQYLKEINSLYQQAGANPNKKINLYVDEKGNAKDCSCTLLHGFDCLTENEYFTFSKELTDRNIIPYSLRNYYQTPKTAFNSAYADLRTLAYQELQVGKEIANILAKVDSDSANNIRFRRLGTSDYGVKSLGQYEYNFYETDLDEKLIKTFEQIHFYSIPDELSSAYSPKTLEQLRFSNKVTLLKAIKNAKHQDFSFESLKALLPYVKNVQDKDVASEYVTSAKFDIKIANCLTEEDFPWQFIKFAMENNFGSHIYSKISFNGRKLPETVFKREHYFNGHKYDCYELMPEWEKANAHLEHFLTSIPDRNWFYGLCVASRENSISDSELYAMLVKDDIKYSVQQLRYLLDYSCHNKLVQRRNFEIEDREHLPQLLSIISEEGYKGFDQYLFLPHFSPYKQIWASHRYLLFDEHIPEYIEVWLNNNPNAINLFSKIQTEESIAQIKFRKALLGDDIYSFSKHDFNEPRLTYNTFQWILNQNFKVSAMSLTYGMICQLIKERFEVKKILPRYLDIVDQSNTEEPCCLFTFTESYTGGFFISNEKYGVKVARVLQHNTQVKEYFAKHMVCDFVDERLFNKLELDENREILVVDSAVKGKDCLEWNDELYEEWKGKRESANIKIYITPKHVQRNFVLSTREKELLNIGLGSREYGYLEDNYVIVTHPNSSGEDIMKALEKVSVSADFFKLPFIALQSLYVEQMLHLQKEAENNNITITEIIKNISGKDGGERLSPELRFIKDNLSEAEQLALINNIDKVRDLLNGEEELPSKVKALVGFIGELIYERYLRYTNQDYEFSADMGIGEYDFKIKAKDGMGDIFVDTKTNLYSFAEGNIPFYLHSSQGAFLQKNPGKRYHIVRISLRDLNLDSKYEEVRYMDDKENLDPRQNKAIRAKCEKIADNYWRQARISEFRGNSKEYMIRLEQPSNEE